jgi:N-acetyl-beta-hexosaminidase
VFAEVQTIFPSNFVHLGGDKYNSNCYDFKTSIKDYMNQNNITSYDDLYDQYFNKVNQFIGNDRHRIYYYID